MQQEDLSQRFEDGESKSGPDARLWPSGDEELDRRQLLDVATENGEDGRGGLIVDTLVQGVHDDNARNF